MKAIAFFCFLLFVSFATSGQEIKNDTLKFIYYTDKLGNQKKAMVAYPKQILIVSGDSIYTILDEAQLKGVVERGGGFNVINNSDSISLFLRDRIKAIIVLKRKN